MGPCSEYLIEYLIATYRKKSFCLELHTAPEDKERFIRFCGPTRMTPPLKQYAILPGRLYVPCELSPSFSRYRPKPQEPQASVTAFFLRSNRRVQLTSYQKRRCATCCLRVSESDETIFPHLASPNSLRTILRHCPDEDFRKPDIK